MKVQFSAYPAYSSAKISKVQMSRMKVSDLNTSEPLTPGVRVSFSGKVQKNKRQVLSIANSDSRLMLQAYRDETSKTTGTIVSNLNIKSGMDSRTILPYYSYDNKNGLIKVAKMRYDKNGKRVDKLPVSDFKSVPLDYTLEAGEQFVIQDIPKNKESKFIELVPTGIKGNISRLKTEALETKNVPYQLFATKNLPARAKYATRYILHTPKMAAFESSKAAEAARDLSWHDFSKAAVDALPKMNSKQFDNFNPMSLILHRRMSFPALLGIADMSAGGASFYNQLRVHTLMYMPDNADLGNYKNPFEFLRMVATKEDWNEIKKLPEYDFIVNVEKNYKNAPKEDIKQVEEILAPYLTPFKDEKGGYSLRMVAKRSLETNPDKVLMETLGDNYRKRAKTVKDGTINPYNRVVDMSGVCKLRETIADAASAARATFWGKVITTAAFFISVGGIAGMVYLSALKPSYNSK